MNISLAELAANIVGKIVQSRELSVSQIIGLGSVNVVFLIETNVGKYIVRLNRQESLNRFKKEHWCINKALLLGIPSPSVIEYGQIADAAYMVQTFVDGQNGKIVPEHQVGIWEKLGQYARLYHSVSVIGFGEDLTDDDQGTFKDSWTRFVLYNMNSLSAQDALLALGVLTYTTSTQLRRRFEELMHRPFTFGLNHGDLSEQNVLVNQRGEIFLLDWGCAGAYIVPHFDFNVVLHSGLSPESRKFQSFLQGYGLSDAEFKEMRPELNVLAALHAVDKLRWAIDRNPAKISEFARQAKQVIALL